MVLIFVIDYNRRNNWNISFEKNVFQFICIKFESF